MKLTGYWLAGYWHFAAVPLIAALALVGSGCDKTQATAGGGGTSGGGGAPQRPPTPVTAADAVGRDVPIYLEEIGRCAASEVVTIQPQVYGQIQKIHFTDGAEVKKGDVLFTIDARPYQAQLEQAQASLARTQAMLAFANLEFSRVETFYKTGSISQQDYDTKQDAVAEAQAQIKADEAAITTARVNVDYCTIRSPIHGRAGQRMVDVGNIVKINDTKLLMIHRLDPIYANFTITERDLANVRAHLAAGTLKASVWLPDEAPGGHWGDLTFLDTAVVDGSGTVNVRATLPNVDRHFWPGQFVRVQLVLDVKKGAVLVPAQAMQIGQAGPFVYVIKADSTADMRPVTPGQRQGDLIVIDQGVKAGERVVTSGQMAVAPGSKVATPEEAASVGAPSLGPESGTAAPGTSGVATPAATQGTPATQQGGATGGKS